MVLLQNIMKQEIVLVVIIILNGVSFLVFFFPFLSPSFFHFIFFLFFCFVFLLLLHTTFSYHLISLSLLPSALASSHLLLIFFSSSSHLLLIFFSSSSHLLSLSLSLQLSLSLSVPPVILVLRMILWS